MATYESPDSQIFNAAVPEWPEGVSDKSDLLRWLDERGLSVAEFKETDTFAFWSRKWIDLGDRTVPRFPWLAEL